MELSKIDSSDMFHEIETLPEQIEYSIKIFDKIGRVFFLLTILCKWESVLKISVLDTINFIN